MYIDKIGVRNMKEKLLILDGNSLMYRAFYGLPALTNSEGLHTNAIYGFATMLLKMKEDINPDHIIATFDRKAPTFRHTEYADYKAGRKKMPEELAEQIPHIRELLEAFGVEIFELDGYEADDLIGTISVQGDAAGLDVFIVTGDRDALQLATDNVKVVINKKGMTEVEIYDKNRMIEEFGVTPTEFIDVKGLMGDKSDNIPGVPGIGEKTAYKLIQEYKSIENVLSNIENIKGKKLTDNLKEYAEQAIFSKKLATIITVAPIEIDFEALKDRNIDSEKLVSMFYKYQFKSLYNKIKVEESGENIEKNLENNEQTTSVEYTEIFTLEVFEAIVDQLKEKVFITYTLKDAERFSTLTVEKIFINSVDKVYVVDLAKCLEENVESTKNILNKIFNGDLQIISHNFKGMYTYLNKLDVENNCISFDTEIAAYLVDPGKKEYTLESIIEGLLHKGISQEIVTREIDKCISLREVYEILFNKIEELQMRELFYEVELPLTRVIAYMESEGFKIDKEELENLGKNFRGEIEKTEKEIFELCDEEFNIKSPKQLGKILFEKMDLPVIKKTKTGYSTNAEVLEELLDKHPVIEKIIYYRQITKLESTYVEGLKAVIDTDGKIHSSFNQTVTTTGRLSSTEPNLQNIPIKYEMGRAIRKVFIPENKESVLLSADYSQIELRVLAEIAGDDNLIDAFVNHADIHTKTASEVFGVPIELVTSNMRSNAKAVNFGIVYGIGDFSLAKDLNITRKEAKEYIDRYFSRYPNVKKYLHDIVESAKKEGEVKTILNRRRFIPELVSGKKMIIALGERLAMNTPIQGSAADIIKLAMVNVYNKLEENGLKSKLILQVHDELILNVYKDELERVKELVRKEMETIKSDVLRVPLEVDVNIGDTWYEAK